MEIKVEDLSKTYVIYKKNPGFKAAVMSLFHREKTKVNALKGISFHVGSGEIVGFVGSNGSGKTTTLKILAGLLSSTDGKVTIDQYIPFEKNYEFLKKLGFISGQKGQLRPDLPAQDSFDFLASVYEINRVDAQKRIKGLSEKLGVEKFLNQSVRLLSLGQKMKFELIASLIHRPQLLLLDEPTLGLDFASAEAIREIIFQEAKENGTTVIISSHILDDIQEICGRMIIINGGLIVFDDLLEKCFESFAKYKMITVRLKANQLSKASQIEKGGIKNMEGTSITWEIPRNKVPHMVNLLMEKIEIDDITINEQPLGKVIELITAANGQSSKIGRAHV